MHLLVTSPALLSALTVSQASVHFAAKNRNSELRQLILSEKSEIVSQESSTVLWSTLGCPCGHKTDEISAPDPNCLTNSAQLRGETDWSDNGNHAPLLQLLNGPKCANIIYRA